MHNSTAEQRPSRGAAFVVDPPGIVRYCWLTIRKRVRDPKICLDEIEKKRLERWVKGRMMEHI